ncbi:PIN domain-containing protein [Isoptericola aurantiacus]|uniref:PIN domain-containing protein n=1 Tax=Isoptericola aurantiacus TaxID=3377839 RepID=UPI00383A75CF
MRTSKPPSAALARIEKRDTDDWPFLAVALLLDCPVWTEDNDFFGSRFRVRTGPAQIQLTASP